MRNIKQNYDKNTLTYLIFAIWHAFFIFLQQQIKSVRAKLK